MLKFIFYSVLLFFIGFFVYFNVRLIPQGQLCLFLDKKNNTKIAASRYFTFLWTGFHKDRWVQRCISKEKQSSIVDLFLDLPYAEFFEVKEHFQIDLVLDIYFQVDLKQSLFIFEKFNGERGKIQDYIQIKSRLIANRFLEILFKKNIEFEDLINSFYKYIKENSFEQKEHLTFLEELKKELSPAGILVLHLDLISLNFPDEKIYTAATTDTSLLIKKSVQHRESVQKSRLKETIENKKKDLEIKQLRKIAQLIEQYPHMIDYFKYNFLSKVESLSFSEVMKVQELEEKNNSE